MPARPGSSPASCTAPSLPAIAGTSRRTTSTPFCRATEPEHDPEKWKPVFGKDHAQTKKTSAAVGSDGAVACMHGRTFTPRRRHTPRDVRERGARLLDRVLPERGVLGRA